MELCEDRVIGLYEVSLLAKHVVFQWATKIIQYEYPEVQRLSLNQVNKASISLAIEVVLEKVDSLLLHQEKL